MSKFAKGPWEVVKNGPKGSEGQIRQSLTGTLIADCPVFKQNASLIAAAPEMYEALKKLCDEPELPNHIADYLLPILRKVEI
jgi:hypothetical protein